MRLRSALKATHNPSRLPSRVMAPTAVAWSTRHDDHALFADDREMLAAVFDTQYG